MLNRIWPKSMRCRQVCVFLQEATGAEVGGEQNGEGTANTLGCSAATWRKEMKDWVMHWQRILQMEHLSWQERCRIATQTSWREVLDFTRVKILNKADPPRAFRSLYEHLKRRRQKRTEAALLEVSGQAESVDDARKVCSQEHGDCGHRRSQGSAHLPISRNEVHHNSEAGVEREDDVLQIFTEDCSCSDFSGQIFLQLMRIVACEMDVRMSALDAMLLEFEDCVTIA
jgi:hypothetical protein